MRKTIFHICVLLLYSGMLMAQQEVIPNDSYFKYQVSFKSPGGRIAINVDSTRPSLEAI